MAERNTTLWIILDLAQFAASGQGIDNISGLHTRQYREYKVTQTNITTFVT